MIFVQVKRLFHLYSSKKEWLTAEDLRKFLQLEQGNVFWRLNDVIMRVNDVMQVCRMQVWSTALS